MKHMVRRIICLATVAGLSFGAFGATYYVKPAATGAGDGSSWADAMAWTDALASCAALEGENEIWLAGDVTASALSTVTVKGDLTVRGGFAGTETSSEGRPANAISTISGNNTCNIIQSTVDADKTLAFERVALVCASYRAVKKDGAGNISFMDCELSGNGRTIGHNKGDVEGLGLYASGGGAATLTRCKLEGNGPTDYIQEGPGGFAIRASGLSRITIDGCTFLTNGLWTASKNDGDLKAHRGIAIYLTNTPLTMRNSRVSGSIAKPRGSAVGAIVTLTGNCGGSVFTNCVFSGNLDLYKSYDRTGGGIVDIDLGSSDQKVDISGCTFAYNVIQANDAGCLAVRKGDVHVTDSTFFYNLLGRSNAHGYGADITVFADGKLAIEKSRLDSLTAGSISSVNPENLTIDTATMTTGNPHFKSSALDFEAIVSFGGSCSVDKGNYGKLVGIDATPLSPAPVKPDIGEGNVLYVDQSATGDGTGSSWENAFTDLGSALAAVSSVKNEIWVKGDLKPSADAVWTEINDSVTVRGGFAGTESAATDRAEGAESTMDGGNSYDFIKVSVAGGRTLTFEDFVFTKAKYRAIFKRGFGDLISRNCKFLNCGTNQNADGRGILAQGGSGVAKLIVETCEFAGLRRSGKTGGSGSGAAINVALHDRFICDDSLFCSNGVPILNGSTSSGTADNRNVKGSTILIQGAPVTMRNTRIAANGGSGRSSGTDGGIVWMDGYVGGSAFTNCAFVGNHANLFKDNGSICNSCGALVLKPSTADQTIDFESCTFAYNLSHGDQSPGGLNVFNGTVKIHNSILWHNVRGYLATSGYGADIDVKGGTVAVSHSIVTGTDISSCRGATLDPNTVTTDDPSFVTSYEDYAAHLNFNDATWIQPGTGYGFASLGSLDVHLLSAAGYWLNDGSVGPATNVTSRAIDSGDRLSAFANEPSPNGGQINLGAYGNTTRASKTVTGAPSVDDITITYPGGYARPKIALTLGLASGTGYKADVTIVCKTGGVEVAQTQVSFTYGSENTIEWMPPYYFDAGTPLTFEYEIKVGGSSLIQNQADSTTEGTKPPFCGKGGGANVIHVREGADCLMNGSDWTDAYPDLATAIQDVGPDKTEIWISKSSELAPFKLTLEAPLAIRGGFAGTECRADERTGTALFTNDLGNAYGGLEFATTAETPVTLDRIAIIRATNRGLSKTGAGTLTLVDCRIADNGRNSASDGRGMYVSGGILVVTNCVFDGNFYNVDADTTGSGGGAYITGCTCATFEGCVFVQNGNRFIPPNYQKTGGSSGGAIYANATRLVCRNTRFAANCIGKGAIVHLNGNCNGSLFEHCAFVGNQMLQHWLGSVGTVCAPLVVAMDAVSRTAEIRNCTFAYNIDTNRSAPGGLLITSGKVVIEDSIFWGNVRSSSVQPETDWPSAEDIEVRGSSTLAMTNVCIRSTSTDTSGPHCLQFANPANVTMCNILTGDPMLVSTSAEVRALTTDPDGYAYYASSVIPQLRGINVHLRGGSGYHDENDNGALVRTYSSGKVGGSSPAIDAGTKMLKGLLEPAPNGRRVNLGAYGNTPWATMSKGGTLIFVR